MSGPANGNGHWKLLGAILVPLILGAIGYGALKNDVQRTREELSTKASRETVQLQYESLLREIQALRSDVQQMRRRP